MSREMRISLASGFFAVAFAAYIYLTLPHARVVESLGILLLKIVPFLFAAVAVAFLDRDLAKRWKLDLIGVPLSYLVAFCWFVPKIFFHAEVHAELYYVVLMFVPFLILSMVLSYRLGGGSTEACLRLAGAMLLLMLSGLEDLAFLVVNHHTDPEWAKIPEVWNWASHMTVFLGHPATKHEAFAFIAVHVTLAIGVLFFPIRKRS